MKKNVMPKQAAPVERLSPATAGAGAGADKGGVVAHYLRYYYSPSTPFAGDDAE
jgi:prenylated cyclic peptide (anacyclamide/piricyclamide family)